jgi:hypothetical protein
MTTENLDERNLSGVDVGGSVHENVLNKLYDISPEDRPFCDMVSTGTSKNHYKEFLEKQLSKASPRNMAVDGDDTTGNDSRTGKRKGNYHMTSTKMVQVSDRSRNVDTIGAADELIQQVTDRQRELRRDEEAALVSNYVAAAGDPGNDVPSQVAGIGGWIGTTFAVGAETVAGLGDTVNNRLMGTNGTSPALSGADGGGFPDTLPLSGTARAITETLLKTAIKASYINGGNVRYAIGTPTVIELVSDYLFTSSARVATMQTNVSQGNRQGVDAGNGAAGGGVVAQGAVNIYVSNYSTLILTPNRFQPFSLDVDPAEIPDVSDLFLIDP